MTFKTGDTIFYPAHGVAKVAGVEVREFGTFKEEFFVLELSRGGRSLVPTKNAEQAGLRPLVSQRKAKELLKSMKDQPIIDKTKSWKDRASKYSEGLKTGAPESYSKILQELMFRARADKLSTTETKMLETARSYFVAEVGEVLDMSMERIDKELSECIAALLPDVGNGRAALDDDGLDDVEFDDVEEDSEEVVEDDEAEAEEGVKAGKKAKSTKKATKKTAKKAPAKKKKK